MTAPLLSKNLNQFLFKNDFLFYCYCCSEDLERVKTSQTQTHTSAYTWERRLEENRPKFKQGLSLDGGIIGDFKFLFIFL